MRRIPLLTFLVSVCAAACSDSPPATMMQPPKVVLTSIAVSARALMIGKGETSTFTAAGTYSDGTSQVLTAVTWVSSNTAIATINTFGVATGVAAGTAEITATSGDVSGRATLTVRPATLTSLVLEPATATLAPATTKTLIARASFDDASTADVTASVVWHSSNEIAATVALGVVSALGEGTAIISAEDPGSGVTSGDHSTTVTVRVEPPKDIFVTPSTPTLPRGRTQQLSATAVYDDGLEADVTNIVFWESSAPAVATVDSRGLVQAVADGFASIRASHASGVSASASVRVVAPEVVTVRVAPQQASSNVGIAVHFRAYAMFSDGIEREVTNSATWTTSDTHLATIDNLGEAMPRALGQVVISARHTMSRVSSDDSNNSATLDIVSPNLVQVLIVPSTTAVPAGLQVHVDAFGVYSDSTGRNITNEVLWQSSDPTLATIDPSGNITGVAEGLATISATDPTTGISSDNSMTSCALTIQPPLLYSIAVSPRRVSLVLTSTQQLTATGTFSDGILRNITTLVNWRSAQNAIVRVNSLGIVTGTSLGGPVQVFAVDPASGISSSDLDQSALVLVLDSPLVSLTVTPTTSSFPLGADVPFRARGTFANNAVADISTLVNWSSSDPAIARVINVPDTKGVAITASTGTVTITAVDPYSGISSADSNGSATLYVSNAETLQAVAVTGPAEVHINQRQLFTASGVFSDGNTYPLTNSVTFASSNPAVAAVSNVEGTAGFVAGVAEGSATISATHLLTGISSDDSNQSSSVMITPSIVIADIIHYELEDGSGTVATNLAPNRPNGTINGTVTWNMPGGAPTNSNYRLTMANGGSNNVNTNLPSLTFSNLTIEFWWRFGSGTGLAYMWNTVQSFRAFTNGVAGTGIFVRVTPGGSDIVYSTNVQNGLWHHIAYVLDASGFQGRFYVDGAQVGSTTYSGSITMTTFFVLGQNGSSGGQVDYDRYRVWGSALTQAQIAEIIAGQR